MTSMRALCGNHIEAYQLFQRAPEGEPSRRAENAMHEAMDAVCTHPCTSEDDALELYHHLLWYRTKEGDQMEPFAQALLAAMLHTPGPSALASLRHEPANDWARA